MSKSIASRKNSRKRAQVGKIQFLQDETVNVGIDVHKNTYSVTIWSEQRNAFVTQWTQPATPRALISAMTKYKKHIAHAVYEAGPTGYELVRSLRRAGFNADVIAPSRTPKTTGQEAKSDRLDSRKLAMWSAKKLLRPVRVPTVEQEEDREIFRARDDMVKKRRRVKQQIKSFLLVHGIDEPAGLKHWTLESIAALGAMDLSVALRLRLDMLLEELKHHEAQLKTVEAALGKIARAPRHKKKIEALKTVPGVGPLTAMAMATELIDPERFDSSREVAAMAGLAPLVSRTGETTRGGALMKCGNKRLRTILIEAAWVWRRKEPWADEIYRRMVANTGDGKKAIAALARRLLIILWRISVTGEPYRPPRAPSPTDSGAAPAAPPCQPGPPNKKEKEGERKEESKTRTRRRRFRDDVSCPCGHRGSRPASRQGTV